jgi:hypothetical protein
VRRWLPVLAALGAVAAVVVPYLALGGATYEPTPVADPCQTRPWRNPSGLQATLEQIALSALDGAACKLHVSREELVLALEDEDALNEFARDHDIERADAEQAVHDGLVRAVDDAKEHGALNGVVGQLVERAVENVPPHLLLSVLEQLRGFIG